MIAMQCRVKRHNAARHASKHIACWRRRIRETVRRLWWRVRQRFEWIDNAVAAATVRNEHRDTVTEAVDRVVLHPVAGPLILSLIHI